MIQLLQFQEEAAAQIAERVSAYLDEPVVAGRGQSRHQVPFLQALSAITGAGKTAILAAAVARISAEMPVAPVVLWLSKRDAVVSQTYANLASGGKYNHLLEHMPVATLADYSPDEVAGTDQPMLFVATVGTFNQVDREDGTLRIYKSNIDGMGGTSTWTALTQRLDGQRRRRPLVVVYDEGQNLSDQQVDLLLELEPDVFLPASATLHYPERLDREIAILRANDYTDPELATRVPTPAVVAAGLVKPHVLLEGYNSPMEETVASLIASMRETEAEALSLGVELRPKAIYVCDTNVLASDPSATEDPKQPFEQRQSPPIQIWRYLTEQCDVPPDDIAVYAALKVDNDYPLPDDFALFSGAAGDFENFTAGDYQHVIFNVRLQEGWDDPSVYYAYIDKSMNSKAQVTQVIGRVLRQPGATHYSSDLLNTAHFYVRVDRKEVFSTVVSEVEKELGAGSGIQLTVSRPGNRGLVPYAPRVQVEVPQTGIDARRAVPLIESKMASAPDFRDGGANVRGTGSRRIVRQKVGEAAEATEWETFEQSSTASARWIFKREIQRQFTSVQGVINWADPKLDAVVGIGSPAYTSLCELASAVVDQYTGAARLKQREANPYRVGTLLARADLVTAFKNSVHEGYAGLNNDEAQFAAALDEQGVVWARNPDRTGFGIDLISPGATKRFYPDFLVWTDARVVCLDTKGPHLIDATARRKLLNVQHSGTGRRLDIQFVSKGKYNEQLERRGPDGTTAWSLQADGQLRATHYEELSQVIDFLLNDDLND